MVFFSFLGAFRGTSGTAAPLIATKEGEEMGLDFLLAFGVLVAAVVVFWLLDTGPITRASRSREHRRGGEWD